MSHNEKSPPAATGGARIGDRFAGLITFEITEANPAFKILAALARLDAAILAAIVFVMVDGGRS
jgi:hypothetical protein